MAKVAERLLMYPPPGWGGRIAGAANHTISTSTDPTITPNRRRVIHANGLYWMFYIKGGGSSTIYYKTSADGLSFSPEYSINLPTNYCTSSGSVGVWLDNNSYLTLATSLDEPLGFLWGLGYRRGHLEINGTITWSDVWQLLSDLTCGAGNTGYGCNHIGLATDLNGYPFITLRTTGGHYVNVVKSSTNNGIWTMAAGYPIILYGSIVPAYIGGYTSLAGYYNSNKMYALWDTNSGHAGTAVLRGRLYDGGWGGTDDICPDAGVNVATFCGASDASGNLYIVWGMVGGGAYLRIRYANGTWGNTIQISNNGDNPTIFYHTVIDAVHTVYSTSGKQVARSMAGIIDYLASLGSPQMSSMLYPDANMGVIYNSSYVGYLNIFNLS